MNGKARGREREERVWSVEDHPFSHRLQRHMQRSWQWGRICDMVAPDRVRFATNSAARRGNTSAADWPGSGVRRACAERAAPHVGHPTR